MPGGRNGGDPASRVTGPRVRNRAELTGHGNVEARRLLLDVVEETLAAMQPERRLADRLVGSPTGFAVDGTDYDLAAFDHVYLVGAGKGSLPLAEAIMARLDRPPTAGVVVEKRGQGYPVEGIRTMEADHPLPTAASLDAGRAMLDVADRAGERDLLIAAVTGGASSLLTVPVDGVTLEAVRQLTDRLLRSGAPIEAVNAVRQQLDQLKGGRLAQRAAPAAVLTFVVVDEVAGEPWGPTVRTEATPQTAIDVLDAYGLRDEVPASVVAHLEAAGGPPAAGPPAPARIQHVVVADSADLCTAAAEAAEARGLPGAVLSSVMAGESRELATALTAVGAEIAERARPVAPPALVICGGETTVTLGDDPGTGGPNQEFALSAARRLAGRPGVTVAAVGTDGTDGPTPFAGGIVDASTTARAVDREVDLERALEGHDATTALEALGDAVDTGPTGTNLMDLYLVHVEAS